MKVMIDFIRDVTGGNERYTIELIKYLNSKKTIKLVVVVSAKKKQLCEKIAPSASIHSVKTSPYHLLFHQEVNILKKYIYLENPDIFHSPTTLLQFWRPSCKTIITIHDLNFLTLKTGLVKILYKKLLYKYSVKYSDVIICVSRYTSNVLCNFVPEAETKSVVIWEGSDIIEPSGFLKLDSQCTIPYILSFGHRAHKNVIDSVRILKKIISLGHSIRLKIIGGGNYIEKDVRKFVNSLGMENHVDYLGKVNDIELDELYKNASALVFLSKYEGFGLPVIEAMSRNCPVIGSKWGSLPEIIGQYGYIMNDGETDAAADYLYKLIKDDEFKNRVIKKAYAYACELTWKKCFDETVRKIYET